MSIWNRVKSVFTGGTRSLDAAGSGRRWGNNPRVVNLNSDIQGGALSIGQKASYYCRNNPNAAAAVNALVSNLVGDSLKIRSLHPDKRVRDDIHRLWDLWCKSADVSGSETFDSMVSLLCRSWIEAGEGFAVMRALPDGSGPVPLGIELVAPEQLPMEYGWMLPPGNLVRSSIEFGPGGRKVAFYILPFNPNDPFAPLKNTWQPERIPAPDVIHLYRPMVPNQIRGLSVFANCITRLRELDEYQDAALARAKVAALFFGVVTDPNDAAAGLVPGQSGPLAAMDMQPATMMSAPPGSSVNFSDPPVDSNYSEFVKNALKSIAVGLGITYEMISGDLRETNYSSARVGLLEFRRFASQLQNQIIIPKLIRPIYERFITLAVMSGALDIPDFGTNPSAGLSLDVLPTAWQWVDPKSDTQAEIEQINAGLKSREQSLAERGYDVEEVDRQIASDKAREKALGLAFTAPSRLEPVQVPVDGPAINTTKAPAP